MMYSNKVFISPGFYYTVFRINNRIILAPCEELKKAQRYFLNAVKWEYSLVGWAKLLYTGDLNYFAYGVPTGLFLI